MSPDQSLRLRCLELAIEIGKLALPAAGTLLETARRLERFVAATDEVSASEKLADIVRIVQAEADA